MLGQSFICYSLRKRPTVGSLRRGQPGWLLVFVWKSEVEEVFSKGSGALRSGLLSRIAGAGEEIDKLISDKTKRFFRRREGSKE